MRTDDGHNSDKGTPHAGHGHGGPRLSHDELAAMGYERRDINLRSVTKAILGFFAFCVFGWGASYIYMWAVGYTHNPNATQARPRKVPPLPNPLLQNNITAKTDMFEMRQHELDHLSSFQYVDAAKTRVSVPVEMAKDIVLRDGVSKGVSMTAQSVGNTSDQRKAPIPGVTEDLPQGMAPATAPAGGPQVSPTAP